MTSVIDLKNLQRWFARRTDLYWGRDSDVDDAKLGSERVSCGNGEITLSSFSKIVACMEKILPFRDEEDLIVDAGSGFGWSSVLLALAAPKSRVIGFEVDKVRFDISQCILSELRTLHPSHLLNLEFRNESFNSEEGRELVSRATHIFAFDWVFSEDTLNLLAQTLAYRDSTRVPKCLLVTFRRTADWEKNREVSISDPSLPAPWKVHGALIPVTMRFSGQKPSARFWLSERD